MDTQSLEESFAILSVNEKSEIVSNTGPLDNETATMEELQVDTQSLDESFAILSVNEKSEIISNICSPR